MLAAWFAKNQRHMDWRETPSLYRTVVSEFMLQQTRVDTVRPYFKRWTTLWPDFKALSGASEEAVVKAWEGLGYYTRARNLRRLAMAVASMPSPPLTAREWAALPGVGPYTAAAIASIACGEPVAVVDGNVVRVLSRLMGDTREFRDNTAAAKAFAAPAGCLLDPAAPGIHNQAVMELGALICLPRTPLCPHCPLEGFCVAGKTGNPEEFPRFLPRKTEKITITRLLCVDSGHILLFRHDTKARRLSGIYELPDVLLFPHFHPAAGPVFVKKRAISNQLITEVICRASPEELHCARNAADTANAGVFAAGNVRIHGSRHSTGTLAGSLEWMPAGQLSQISLSGPHRKWLSSFLPVPQA
jgi:A/G-specific adenine glycosylase